MSSTRPQRPPTQFQVIRTYDSTPQNYLRIPGLVFDDTPALIPYDYRHALTFLQPTKFKLTLSWDEYFDHLQPFQDVASKLVDIFYACVDELRHGATVPEDGQAANWRAFFQRVLAAQGDVAEEAGLGYQDLMWIVFLYSRALVSTRTVIRRRDRTYWLKAEIHYFHDLLMEWVALLKERELKWTTIFGELFGAS
ncbi:hypothetical protein CSOJ01_07635 [Colletotrichum sojae]|uniref:Uncharacterized protein n=1 Tax=Colletotrichum sojae TaxID=2175907 RepID=A0A8H6J8F8_9PEZI|nr:hypothetical protein CSOJ01_07635 [Colletotrichum sojae]